MEILNLLENQSAEIIKAALSTLSSANLKSYSKSSMQENKTRLINLFTLTQQCIVEKNLLPMTEYAAKIAKERFQAGFDLYEVHFAFNVLEQELWNRILKNIKPEMLGVSLGYIGTVLGAGKESLALAYVSLASKHKTETMNLEGMFNR